MPKGMLNNAPITARITVSIRTAANLDPMLAYLGPAIGGGATADGGTLGARSVRAPQ